MATIIVDRTGWKDIILELYKAYTGMSLVLIWASTVLLNPQL